MNAQELITTSNMEANMELIYPSLAEEDRRIDNEAKKIWMSDHLDGMSKMLDELRERYDL